MEELRILRRKKFEELRENGIPIIQENIDLVKKFRDEFPNMRHIVVSSASRSDINKNLSIAQLENFFESIVSYEEVENMPRKPAPDIYLHALKSIGLPPEACLAFEDTRSGVLSAKDAGIQVVALPNRITAKQDFTHADLVLSLKERKDVYNILNLLTNQS